MLKFGVVWNKTPIQCKRTSKKKKKGLSTSMSKPTSSHITQQNTCTPCLVPLLCYRHVTEQTSWRSWRLGKKGRTQLFVWYTAKRYTVAMNHMKLIYRFLYGNISMNCFSFPIVFWASLILITLYIGNRCMFSTFTQRKHLAPDVMFLTSG